MNNVARAHIEQELCVHITHAEPVQGGFTHAEKLVATTDGEPREVFIKMADIRAFPSEAIVLDTESSMYALVSRHPNLRRHFPGCYGYLREGPYRILLLQYLADVSWGGPWTRENITKIHNALRDIHRTILTDVDAKALQTEATALRDTLNQTDDNTFNSEQRKTLVRKAWNPATGEFTNSRGKVYWRAEPRFGKDILTAAQNVPKGPTALTVADVNFGNIGFSAEQAYIVDPVYLILGNPAGDIVGLGVNILRDLPKNDPELRAFVIETFMVSKETLADLLTYWIACSALECKPGMEAWMDYQQNCGETALRLWQEHYWPADTPSDTIKP